MKKPRLLIFASGTKEGGGSGFGNLVAATKIGVLEAEIVGVVCNHEHGGVHERADRLGIRFILLHGPFPSKHDSVEEQELKQLAVDQQAQIIVGNLRADYVAFSGLLKLIRGLDPRKTFNIHPGPLPKFGGPGMYGHRVHEAVFKAHLRAESPVMYSAITMHFVTDEYDKGPIFFQYPIDISDAGSAEEVARRVRAIEGAYQPFITHFVVSGAISWNGKNKGSLQVPEGYTLHKTTFAV